MKTTTTLSALLITTFVWVATSCSSMYECDRIKKRHAFILMDLSDKALFKEEKSDLKENFPVFMKRTRIGDISPCERFSLSFAHLGGQATLDISTQFIEISREGLSRQEEKRQANPKDLRQLMKKKLDDYNRLTEDPVVTSSTNIANVLLKSINQADLESENVFLVMTDGVENNDQINLYRGFPDGNNYSELVDRLIETSVLEKFLEHQKQGLQAKVIMVLKNEPAGKVDRRKIKAFWISIFKELDLQYEFVDNLTNNVDI